MATIEHDIKRSKIFLRLLLFSSFNNIQFLIYKTFHSSPIFYLYAKHFVDYLALTMTQMSMFAGIDRTYQQEQERKKQAQKDQPTCGLCEIL
ncbi:hypothetical protein BX070DRAFT_70317 [Coemansia spiralis]|nr:hypothetical protein BX070DRAFT_70317 [Coemansia spiralis]